MLFLRAKLGVKHGSSYRIGLSTLCSKGSPVSIQDFIIAIFVFVDDRLKAEPSVRSHSQEKLSPSELVTIGLLFALKGVNQSQFDLWLRFNYGHLFPHLPHRTRLFKRLATQQDWCDLFLAEAGLLCIADSYVCETIHPRRQGRATQLAERQGKKGLSNQRWTIGVKSCMLVNHLGRIVDWQWQDANVHDSKFRPLIAEQQSVVFADGGFHGKVGDPDNMKVCKRGEANFRFLVETVFSLLTRFHKFKHITERTYWFVQSHLAFAIAAFNAVMDIFASQPDHSGNVALTMPKVCLGKAETGGIN